MRLITKNSNDYDEIYMKIKLHSDGELPKSIEVPRIKIAVGAVLHKITNFINKYSQLNVYINYRLEKNKNIICEIKRN